MAASRAGKRSRLWRYAGGALGLMVLAWVLRDVSVRDFVRVLGTASPFALAMLALTFLLEQALHALKWQQMLSPLRRVGLWRLYGAVMAGYLANLVTPVRVSPIARAWLVGRLEGLSASTLLATIALERLVDGFVFVGFSALAVVLWQFPGESGAVRAWLAGGALMSLVLFAGLVGALVVGRHPRGAAFVVRAAGTATRPLPARWRASASHMVRRFFEGVVWPEERWRGALVVGLSLLMKLVALGEFLWAGLAFGVMLAPEHYLVLMVVAGFLIMLAGSLRIVGGFAAGAVFALEQLGVEVERALAIAMVVDAAMSLSVAAVGVAALWRFGVSLAEVGRARDALRASPDRGGGNHASEG